MPKMSKLKHKHLCLHHDGPVAGENKTWRKYPKMRALFPFGEPQKSLLIFLLLKQHEPSQCLVRKLPQQPMASQDCIDNHCAVENGGFSLKLIYEKKQTQRYVHHPGSLAQNHTHLEHENCICFSVHLDTLRHSAGKTNHIPPLFGESVVCGLVMVHVKSSFCDTNILGVISAPKNSIMPPYGFQLRAKQRKCHQGFQWASLDTGGLRYSQGSWGEKTNILRLDQKRRWCPIQALSKGPVPEGHKARSD